VRAALRAVLRESGCARACDGFAAACCPVRLGNPAREMESTMESAPLYVREASGTFVPANYTAVISAAKSLLKNRLRRGAVLASPEMVRDFLAVTLGGRDCEYFCLLMLDGRNRFLRFVELFRGTINGASVHPREVVKLVLESEASSVLLVHNHPSEIGEPSAADELITRRLKDLLAMIEVKVLDHLIVAGADTVSFAERGLL
jgi:DNA repair protein RadC